LDTDTVVPVFLHRHGDAKGHRCIKELVKSGKVNASDLSDHILSNMQYGGKALLELNKRASSGNTDALGD